MDWFAKAIFSLKTVFSSFLTTARGAAKRIQAKPGYRSLASRLQPRFTIAIANRAERAKFFGDADLADSVSSTLYVARRKQSIVGFVHLVRHPPEDFPVVGHWFSGLEVRLLWRRMGLGERLVRRVIDQAKAENASMLSCLVYEDNHAALNLYRKLGFEKAVIPGLEEQLEAERSLQGRRRVLFRKPLV
jgi:ribosomal protein S18 acetylase RimI-like enzyme